MYKSLHSEDFDSLAVCHETDLEEVNSSRMC